MKRNKLLSFSLYFFRFVQICLIFFLFFSLFLMFIYQVFPEKLSSVRFTPIDGAIEMVNIKAISVDGASFNNSIAIGEIQPIFIYLIYLQIVTVFILSWLAIREVRNVIRSLQQLQTFQDNNVKAFRKIGMYFLINFVLSCFSFFMVGKRIELTFDFDIYFATLAVISYILAEIFKEGNRLQEEHQLTV
jgi:hypothetical protein